MTLLMKTLRLRHCFLTSLSVSLPFLPPSQTNSPLFKSQQFSVLRRYSDFRWLHAALVHCNPGIFIPPIPEKVKLGRFQPELIESRRIGLENAVNKMLKHRKLYKDEDLKMFLESENFAIDVSDTGTLKSEVVVRI